MTRPAGDEVTVPAYGSIVESACGGSMEFTPETPYAVYEGRVFFFCLPACKATFEEQPAAFLAGDIPHF